MSFPLCVLHNTNIVDQFPRSCPLGDKDTHEALMRMLRTMYWDGESDPHAAEATAQVFDICNGCVPDMLSNVHVSFLRRQPFD